MNVLYVVSNAAAVSFTVERGDASLGLGEGCYSLNPFGIPGKPRNIDRDRESWREL